MSEYATSITAQRRTLIDHIFFKMSAASSGSSVRVEAEVVSPTVEEVNAVLNGPGALPNDSEPSDHLPVVVRFTKQVAANTMPITLKTVNGITQLVDVDPTKTIKAVVERLLFLDGQTEKIVDGNVVMGDTGECNKHDGRLPAHYVRRV